MAAESILAGLNEEATQQELLSQMTLLLAAILEKLPRVDTADRLMISHAESNPTVAIASAQTLATLTTAGVLQNLGTASRPADGIPHHISNAGAMHIYDNIKVS